ncbi:MAG: hypothetical protein GXO55_11085 [Chloroflexi bacterium]|nr:hypothetical protein [Chloroflexota bacterium]
MGVPATLLRKLYVTGSLRNTPTGFQFQLKNRLAPATLLRFGGLKVDGRYIATERVYLHVNDDVYPASHIDVHRPVLFQVNHILTVIVEGETLSPGSHHLTCDLYAQEVGWLHIPIEDELREFLPTSVDVSQMALS